MPQRILITGGSGFIGRNLIEALSPGDAEVYNLDIRAANPPLANGSFVNCDILDAQALASTVRELKPEKIVHLAARTDTDGAGLDDYTVNTEGTRNLIEAANTCKSLERVIITSTQFVVGPGSLPQHDEDFRPHTVYGESKAIAERMVRQSTLECAWTIVRPTNVWGPWHPRYPNEFWRIMRQGRYLHPGRKPVIRSYAYVGNVVYQIRQILEAPVASVDRKVFYLGDPPIDLYCWTSAFSRSLVGREPRIVRRGVVRALALMGDGITRLGGTFPLTSSRYRSMTVDYPTPMAPTIERFGTPPYSLEEGVEQTVGWLRSQDEYWR
jgi:nucleoside-diphosphate-sugar epimerase